uniref:Trimethylguanosine synthase n=1 Tax=Palpitomonas bilix TaxID=652834 RepID=A0A7S3D6T0_9EUKA|mmetsp:Transcript_2451/g.5099  ORF Transcript_2451/g.5099 Transcript_2451/m.5099 type:complete len:525 (+) Transcript_2451:98-1672(+)
MLMEKIEFKGVPEGWREGAKWKRDIIFEWDADLVSRAWLNKECDYSFTDQKTSRIQANILHSCVQGEKSNGDAGGNSSKDVLMVDGTASAGGNSIQFAKVFGGVVSVEINPEMCKGLHHNTELTGVAQQVQVINKDFSKWLYESETKDLCEKAKVSLLFLDPPWGGPSYKDHKQLKLKLGEKWMDEIVADASLLFDHIMLKLPENIDRTWLLQRVDEGEYKKLHHVEMFSFRKMLTILLHFREGVVSTPPEGLQSWARFENIEVSCPQTNWTVLLPPAEPAKVNTSNRNGSGNQYGRSWRGQRNWRDGGGSGWAGSAKAHAFSGYQARYNQRGNTVGATSGDLREVILDRPSERMKDEAENERGWTRQTASNGEKHGTQREWREESSRGIQNRGRGEDESQADSRGSRRNWNSRYAHASSRDYDYVSSRGRDRHHYHHHDDHYTARGRRASPERRNRDDRRRDRRDGYSRSSSDESPPRRRDSYSTRDERRYDGESRRRSSSRDRQSRYDGHGRDRRGDRRSRW